MSLLLLAGLTLLLGGTAAQSAGPVVRQVQLERLPRCWGCGDVIVDDNAHYRDEHLWHGECCPDPECRRIEQDVDGGW